MSDRYTDQLKIVIKQFPLASHKFARKASQASLAAHKQGKFWEFHEKLFKNYNRINDEKIEEIAEALQLDMAKFRTDINLPDIHRIINRDIQNGREIGVTGTPTIFINGKQTRLRDPAEFIKKIEAELKKATRSDK